MEQFIKDNLILLFAISIITAVIAAGVSIVYRVAKKKNLPSIPDHEVLFMEKWASGGSEKNELAKLGSASNCLSVKLTRDALVIRPMFPFNLMFFPEVYDLEHVIPLSAIESIDSSDPDGRNIVIEFKTRGIREKFELSLRRREEFLRAIKL